MPLIALGSIVGLVVTLFLRLGPRESSLLAAAGSFSAISALFGGPIVGGVMMVESGAAGLGAALAPALLPGFVAAAVGYVLYVGFGDWGASARQGSPSPACPRTRGRTSTTCSWPSRLGSPPLWP
jgi:H+/Cl- antiporter ClcA